MHMAGNWSVMFPPLGCSQVMSDSLRSRFWIMALELGEPEKFHGNPTLITLFRDMSTIRIV